MNEPDVLILDADYDIQRSQVAQILDRFPLDLDGKKILVKPNLLGLFKPDQGVTTHPSLVRATVQCLRDRGAIVTVGDNPGLRGFGDNERIAEITGIREASEGAYKNIAGRSTTISLPRAGCCVQIASAILESDLVISLPKLKAHVLTQITCAIKNTYGYVVGAEKTRLHAMSATGKAFCETVVDIYQIRPPDLTIVDAVVGMEGDGPSAGKLRKIGKVIAGRDACSVDWLVCGIMGLDPKKTHQLRIANERGLIPKPFSEMNVEGDWSPLKDFKMPSTFLKGIGPTVFNMLSTLLRRGTHLAVDEAKCVKCGICAKQCPVDAITMEPYPLFGKKCIRCYCCHEICPETAIAEEGLMRYLRTIWGRK